MRLALAVVFVAACAPQTPLTAPGTVGPVADEPTQDADDAPVLPAARAFSDLGASWPDTSGVAVHGALRMAVVGAFGNTCEVSVDAGDVGVEFDPSNDEETVVDGEEQTIGLSVMTATETGLQISSFFDGRPIVTQAALVGDVSDAHFTPEGVVAAVSDAPGRCFVAWMTPGLDIIDTMPVGGVCGQIATGDDTEVFAVVDGQIFKVSAAGAERIDAGDIVVYAEPEGVVVTAERGAHVLTARDVDGAPLWRVTTAEPILDVAAHAGAIIAATGTLSGTLTAYDPLTGTEIGTHALLDAPESLHPSDSDILSIADRFGVRFVSVTER